MKVIPSMHVEPLHGVGTCIGLHTVVQTHDGIGNHVCTTEGLIISMHINKDTLNSCPAFI
jgi:hypothetical protein